MTRRPHCHASTITFGDPHCHRDCAWTKCVSCGATYQDDAGFLNKGKTTWHSSTEGKR